ncbi:hypothetical protein D6D01_10382 [Aureobasidium pullulans]|uniref:Uncharacterized protein n=1 Tax=Aureobasidium pullulans TaxID=5580 RepID=A0A4S9JIR1_AURPU|nr:hypothetical protein D6D01_10382 [Aureobasidium pullulans]
MNANLLYHSTLSFRCIGPTKDNHRCNQDITRAAMEKVELALRVYLRPGGPLTRFGVERLAKSCICEMHSHRTDVVEMVTSQWYADPLGTPRKSDVDYGDDSLKDHEHIEKSSIKQTTTVLANAQHAKQEIENLKREKAVLEKTSNDLAVAETLLCARLAVTEHMNKQLSDMVKQLQDDLRSREDIISRIEVMLD